MQTVQAFMSQNRGGAGSASSGGATSSGPSSSQLSGLSKAGSAVSSLSKFALSLQQSAALRQQAQDEQMAARQEYVSAQETANAIDARYQNVIGAQHAAGVASGVDLSSASLTQARYTARQNADAAIAGARNTADMNIALRRARAAALKQQAAASTILGVVNLAADVATVGAGG